MLRPDVRLACLALALGCRGPSSPANRGAPAEVDTMAAAPFIELLREMVTLGTVSATDLDMFFVTDSIPEAMAHIEQHAITRFAIRAHDVVEQISDA